MTTTDTTVDSDQQDAAPAPPIHLRFPHVPALDGLRGAGVVAVLLYHGAFLDQTWLSGGYLGVDLFFVLSGYLITSLLLVEFSNTGGIDLTAFWGRRLRRLLPALLVVLVGVAIYALVIARPIDLHQIREDGLGTLFYVANWTSIFRGGSYWDISLAPSPLQHTWSLAIEEQFYLLWPILVWMLGRRMLPSLSSKNRGVVLARRVQALGLVGAVVSTLLFTGLWYLGASESRVYQGTDTRAFALFMGITLAATKVLWSDGAAVASRRVQRHRFTALELAGLISVILLGWAWVSLEGTSPALYQGLLPVCSLLAVVVIAAASVPGSPVVGPALSIPPLRWFGLISYGLYLWHWPLYLVITPDRTGLSGASLLLVRIVSSVAVAALSYVLVEQPIRTKRWTFARPVPSMALSMGCVAVIVMVASSGATNQTGGLDASGPRQPRTMIAGAPRVAYAGDSVAYSLGSPVVKDPAAFGVNPTNLAGVGCEFVADGRRVRFPSGGTRPGKPCREKMLDLVIVGNPDAVVLALGSPFAQLDIEIDGSFRSPCQPEYQLALRELYDEMATDLTAKGSVLLTSTTVPLTVLAPSNERERVSCINDVIRSVAEQNANVELLDLEEFVCPGGDCRELIDGDPLRPDGLHFSGPGGSAVSAWVVKQAVAAAEDR
ncbi:MAG: acyltransferase family protein [Aquihabitans sp.]